MRRQFVDLFLLLYILLIILNTDCKKLSIYQCDYIYAIFATIILLLYFDLILICFINLIFINPQFSPTHRSNMNQQSLEQILPKQKDFDFICYICNQYVCITVQTHCNHIFCDICLQNYLLYIDQCPICQQQLRCTNFHYNKLIDGIISQYLRKENQEQWIHLNQRIKNVKMIKQSRKPENLQIGSELDVRDENYVWGVAKIQRIKHFFMNENKESIFVIFNVTKQRQQININSNRLAAKGSFTNREDIPRYYRKKVVYKDKDQVYKILDWNTDGSENNNRSA